MGISNCNTNSALSTNFRSIHHSMTPIYFDDHCRDTVVKLNFLMYIAIYLRINSIYNVHSSSYFISANLPAYACFIPIVKKCMGVSRCPLAYSSCFPLRSLLVVFRTLTGLITAQRRSVSVWFALLDRNLNVCKNDEDCSLPFVSYPMSLPYLH